MITQRPDASDRLPIGLTVAAAARGTARLAVSGDVDMDTSGRLTDAVAELLREAPNAIEVDLGAVRFLDSSGIRAVVLGHARAAERGCRLTVVAVPPTVRRALEITGVWDLIGS